MTDLIVIGASGLAREALGIVREAGIHRPIGVLDDDAERLGGRFAGLPVLGAIEDLARHRDAEVLVCVGSGAAREHIVARLVASGIDTSRFARVIDPSVRNPAGCPIGVGSILLANVSITADVTIGEHVVVMPGATVTHDNVIEDYVTLAAGVTLGGGVHVGRGAYIGMNACVLPGRRIGARALVGMASAVLHDVPDNETWAGVPARPVGSRGVRGERSEPDL